MATKHPITRPCRVTVQPLGHPDRTARGRQAPAQTSQGHNKLTAKARARKWLAAASSTDWTRPGPRVNRPDPALSLVQFPRCSGILRKYSQFIVYLGTQVHFPHGPSSMCTKSGGRIVEPFVSMDGCTEYVCLSVCLYVCMYVCKYVGVDGYICMYMLYTQRSMYVQTDSQTVNLLNSHLLLPRPLFALLYLYFPLNITLVLSRLIARRGGSPGLEHSNHLFPRL